MPLKKVRSSIGSNGFASNETFASPPHTPHQPRTKVKPPPPRDMPQPLFATVYGNGGSEVPWPLGPNLQLATSAHNDNVVVSEFQFDSPILSVCPPPSFAPINCAQFSKVRRYRKRHRPQLSSGFFNYLGIFIGGRLSTNVFWLNKSFSMKRNFSICYAKRVTRPPLRQLNSTAPSSCQSASNSLYPI